jgi:pimeloyl-ACP methyl ester carboxylesterase
VQNPVLIIQGKQDMTTPIEEARAYLSVLPNGKLELIEGGHFAFAENPLPFNLTAEEFLL